MAGRPSHTKRRLEELRMLKFCNGSLTRAEQAEARWLLGRLRESEKRKRRYATDPEYRRQVCERAAVSQRARREARA